MKQLYKKTLLAVAVASICGKALAGDVSVTKQVHSLEGLEDVTATQTSEAITYKVAAAYRDGDKITFTFSDGALEGTTFPSQLNVAAVDSATEADSIAGMALGLLNTTDNSVTYRVTQVTQPDDTPGAGGTAYTDRTTIGATIALGTIGYKASAVAAGSITISVASETSSGDVLDNSGTRTATLAEAKTQFGSAKMGTSFDSVINVSAARKAFAVGSTDTASFTITNPTTTGWLNMATVNTTSANLFGEAGKMGTLSETGTEFSTATTSTRTFDRAGAKLGISYAGLVTNDTITFTPPTGTNAVVLEAQKFSLDLAYNYTSAGAKANSKTISTALSAGEWTLNGAKVSIPYMPYQANASQILYVTNEGTQDGDILATAFDEKGNVYDLGIVGVAKGEHVTKVTKPIGDALLAKGFSGGKVAITITVNAPESDITVYAGYNVGGADRGYVNTDQYKGKE